MRHTTKMWCDGKAVRKPVPGETYVALFKGSGGNRDIVEDVTFLGEFSEDGDPRRKFRSTDRDGRTYDWDAFKFGGRWSFGTSAESLSIYPAGTSCFERSR